MGKLTERGEGERDHERKDERTCTIMGVVNKISYN